MIVVIPVYTMVLYGRVSFLNDISYEKFQTTLEVALLTYINRIYTVKFMHISENVIIYIIHSYTCELLSCLAFNLHILGDYHICLKATYM